MASRLERRLAKLEGANRSGFLKVIISRFGRPDGADIEPIWHPAGRVLVVYEGYEHLGDELMRSIGEVV
jgi:hypothetical protein